MQTFKESITNAVWQFEADVVVSNTSGVYSFTDALGNALNVPATLQPYTIPAPTAAQLLAQAQAVQLGILAAAYQSAIQHPVSYTSKGGVTETYQADIASQGVLATELAVYTSIGVTPTGFYWVAADNTQVPFALSDLQGLAGAMGMQGWPAFEHLQTQKSVVLAATTVAAVIAVVW